MVSVRPEPKRSRWPSASPRALLFKSVGFWVCLWEWGKNTCIATLLSDKQTLMFLKTWTVFQESSLNLCKGVEFWKSSGHAKGDVWPYCSSCGTPGCLSVDLMAFSCTVELVHIILLLWTEIEISGKTMGPDVSWKIAVWRRKPSQKKKTGSGFQNYIWCIGCLLPAYTVEIACCLILVFSFKCEKAR